MNRRDFVRKAAIGSAAISVLNKSSRLTAAPAVGGGKLGSFTAVDNVRVGVIGVGNRGFNLVRNLLQVPNVQIVAVCDLYEARVKRTQDATVAAGFDRPDGYAKGEYDYRRMLERGDLDLVLIMTPWEWHHPMAVDSLKAGIHNSMEVPGVQRLDECWELTELSEKSGAHCMCLENYCYFREIMAVYNMIEQGLFGDPLHVYAGYQKESLYYNFNSDGSLSFSGKGVMGHWGNVYASHFAGPSAQWMGINRGDAFDYVVSMGVWGKAYKIYTERYFGDDHQFVKNPPQMADVSNSMIATKNGKCLSLIHDTRLPRPYRHYFRLQASNGIYEHTEKRVHIGDHSPGDWSAPRGLVDPKTGRRERLRTPRREWEPLANYYADYEHPVWAKVADIAANSGHGGGDYVMMYRLIKSMNRGEYPDIDVYDTAAWSSIMETSEESARNRSKPVDIPDFTRGMWKKRDRLPIFSA